MNVEETIVAISSAVGCGSRMIVRASGPGVRGIHSRLTGDEMFVAGSARQAILSISGMCIPSWVYCFASPASATGQDVVEFHIPGNPILARMLLGEMTSAGARQAETGEFTARAYFNGKMDLAEAEGVAATIGARSERELLAARQLMAGELARRLKPLMDSVADILALIEAGIDFTDQDISFITGEQVHVRVSAVTEELARLLSDSTRFERLSHEPRIVLAGRPNAGKSTLLNAMACQERAIVSPVAGTTRDLLIAHVHLARGMVYLIDAAGLEESPESHPIGQAMNEQASRAIEEADLVILVRDCIDNRPAISLSREPALCVLTKIDLPHDPSRQGDIVAVSAQTGDGIDALRRALDELAFGRADTDATLALNARHVELIESAIGSLKQACSLLPGGGLELLALELREALDDLGGVLGSVSPDDVLGKVFSRFCIGK